jgi:hypothetical protein
MPNTHPRTALYFANFLWDATAPAARAGGHEKNLQLAHRLTDANVIS